MKKLLLIPIYCILILSVGCSNSANHVVAPQNAVEYGYFYYPNTDWGMTVDEVKESLNLKDDEFVLVEQNEDNLTPNEKYEAKQKFLGDDITTKFEFSCTNMSKVKTLRSVTLVYPNDITADEFDSICGDIDKFVANQDIEVAGGGIEKRKGISTDNSNDVIWVDENDNQYKDVGSVLQRLSYFTWSVADMTTVPQELRDSYNAVCVLMIDEQNQPDPPKNYKTNDFTQSLKEHLCRISAVYTSDTSTGQNECKITISGHAIAQMYEYADIYSTLK